MKLFKYILYKITHPIFRFYWRLFKPKTSGARAIILHEENVLLVKNINFKYWLLPGGMIDGKQTPEECLFRELKEGLDLSLNNFEYKLGEYFSEQEGKKDTIHVFIIKLDSPFFKKQWELEDAKWFPLNLLPENIGPATKRRIEEYKTEKRDLVLEW